MGDALECIEAVRRGQAFAGPGQMEAAQVTGLENDADR